MRNVYVVGRLSDLPKTDYVLNDGDHVIEVSGHGKAGPVANVWRNNQFTVVKAGDLNCVGDVSVFFWHTAEAFESLQAIKAFLDALAGKLQTVTFRSTFFDADKKLDAFGLRRRAIAHPGVRLRPSLYDYSELGSIIGARTCTVIGRNPVTHASDKWLEADPSGTAPPSDTSKLFAENAIFRYLEAVFDFSDVNHEQSSAFVMLSRAYKARFSQIQSFVDGEKPLVDLKELKLIARSDADSGVFEGAFEELIRANGQAQAASEKLQVFSMKNATVLGGNFAVFAGEPGRVVRESIFLFPNKNLITPLWLRAALSSKDRMVDFSSKHIFVLPNAAWGNYYHWAIDCMPGLALHKLLPEKPLIFGPKLTSFRRAYMDLARASYNFEYEELLDGSVARADEMFMHTGVAVWGHFSQPGPYPIPHLKLYRQLRDAAAKRLAGRVFPDCIYISRLDTPNRAPENEEQLAGRLQDRGFEVITPGRLTVEEQIMYFDQAKVIVGLHGAGMANLIFSRPGTSVHEICPESWKNPCFERICYALDHKYECSFHPTNTWKAKNEMRWRVDVEEVLRSMDKAGLVSDQVDNQILA